VVDPCGRVDPAVGVTMNALYQGGMPMKVLFLCLVGIRQLNSIVDTRILAVVDGCCRVDFG